MTQPPLKLRSPLLVRLPDPHISWAARANRITKRMIVFAAVIAIPVLIILTVHFRALEEVGFGHALYTLHDTVFLPLKGHLHTRYLPLILVVWGFLATLIALILLSRFTDRSFIKGPHVALLRFMVRRRAGRLLLRHSSSLFSLALQKPRLALNVAEEAWEKALIHLSEQELGSAHRGYFWRVWNRFELVIELRRHYAGRFNILMLLEQWHVCVLLFEVYLSPTTRTRVLPRTLPLLERMLRIWRLPAPPDDLYTPDNLFHPVRLVQDARDLYILSLMRAGVPPTDPLEEAPEIRVQRAWAARLQFLENYAAHLQAGVLGGVSRAQLPATLNIPEDWLPFAARLSLNFALHYALLTETPFVWQRYLNALEGLHLLTNLNPPEAPSEKRGMRLFNRGAQTTSTPLERAGWLIGNFRDNLNYDPDNPTALDTFLPIEAHTTAALGLLLERDAQKLTREVWQERGVIERGDFAFEASNAALFDTTAALLTSADTPLLEEPDEEDDTLSA